MELTEAEAKTKLCPLILIAKVDVHLGDEITGKPFCIGERCMMFRKRPRDNKWPIDGQTEYLVWCGFTR